MDADVAQHEHRNIKRYDSALVIYRLIFLLRNSIIFNKKKKHLKQKTKSYQPNVEL